MLQRRRPRANDQAIVAVARELLEAGANFANDGGLPPEGASLTLTEVRFAATEAGYQIGVAYVDALTARHRALIQATRLASAPRLASIRQSAIARAEKFGAIVETIERTVRADAGE